MGRSRAFRAAVAVMVSLLSLVAGSALAACGGSEETTAMPTTRPSATASTAPNTVKVTRDVAYGSNTTYSGATKRLALDVFEPSAGPGARRPLLILLPGGGFQPDLTDKSQLTDLATAIAQRGIVVACIDYRTFDGSKEMTDAVLRTVIVQGMQDARAAVRFFRKDAATADVYGIDPARIFLGGHSAGAVDSGQAVYLDDLDKADRELRAIVKANGGLEGDSGASGYDSSVSGWIDLAGWLEDKDWVTSDSPPMLAVYGTNDEMVSPGDTSLTADLQVSGARSLYDRAVAVGLTVSQMYEIEGGDHFAPIDASDSELISRIVAFIQSQ